MTKFLIGIDVGGTYTDLISVDSSGKTVFVKSPSTPEDQSIGVMKGLEDLARHHSLGLRELLASTTRVVHGTTVATNALLERKGARVALITTEGHRDVLEMREGLKPDRYNLRISPPEPLVPRYLRLGVRERLRHDGSVLEPLDLGSLDQAVSLASEHGATSLAICFLHSYRNPEHERAAAEHVRARLPHAYVTCSSDVLPQIKEYERISTTVVNAYVGPRVQRYLTNLERRLADAGFANGIFIILSHGGVAPIEEAARVAAATVLSGPAGGIAGARRCAELLGCPNVIPFDMGGTSTDISLVTEFESALSSDRGLAGERIALRSLDISSIGAGGGTVARVDSDGSFRVGPDSAGADPGPACYGRGGEMATVTDANLVLGYLDSAALLSGGLALDANAGKKAVQGLATRLKLDLESAAEGVSRLINIKMADAVRLITLRQGVDPRNFALLSFGGAAGLHAVEVARQLEISRVIVPTFASVLSAWGMLDTDLRIEASRTCLIESSDLAESDLRSIYQELERRATERLRSWFDGPIRLERSAEMRYGEQIFEIDVDLSAIAWDDADLVPRICERFHRKHEELFTYAFEDRGVVLVNARVTAIGEVPSVPTQERPTQASAAANSRNRQVYLEKKWQSVPVYRMDALRPGDICAGPALLESDTTTVLIGRGDEASVNRFGWLDISVKVNESPITPSRGDEPAEATSHA